LKSHLVLITYTYFAKFFGNTFSIYSKDVIQIRIYDNIQHENCPKSSGNFGKLFHWLWFRLLLLGLANCDLDVIREGHESRIYDNLIPAKEEASASARYPILLGSLRRSWWR
jgi:hypothetical protein